MPSILPTAEILCENGITIGGRSRQAWHCAGDVYVHLLNTGGNQIELFGDCGYLIFDQTWKTVTTRREHAGHRRLLWRGLAS
ncbi:MAG: hypothetical protein R2867_17810 [Caldilineaceae bacterium]